MSVLLPGETLPTGSLFSGHRDQGPLALGPGVRLQDANSFGVKACGKVAADDRKRVLWLENNGRGRYIPTAGDLVIAKMHHSSTDQHHLSLSPQAPFAILPQLAFEGATKKTRPMLQPGDLVYARVSLADKHAEVVLECVNPSTGKSDTLGELKGGMIFDVSLGLARRLMMRDTKVQGEIVVLEELARRGLHFELAVGRNGLIWINSDDTDTILQVGSALRATDEGNLTAKQQLNYVARIVSQR